VSPSPRAQVIQKPKKKQLDKELMVSEQFLAGRVLLDEWNLRFQMCLDRIYTLHESCAFEQKMAANIELMHLSEDFVHASRTFGKIIISEAPPLSLSLFLSLSLSPSLPYSLSITPSLSFFFSLSLSLFLSPLPLPPLLLFVSSSP
jgi:hypothetical protein